MSPGHDAHLLRAEDLLAAGRPADAEQVVERLLDQDPANGAALELLGRAWCDQGRFREALRLGRHGLATHPGSLWPHLVVCLAHVGLGSHGDAVATARGAVRDHPDQARAHALLARVHAADPLGDRGREGVAAARRAVELEPQSAEHRLLLGTHLEVSRQGDAARSAYEEALRIDPTSRAAMVALASMEDRRTAAVERVQRIADELEHFPDDAVLHSTLRGLLIHTVGWFGVMTSVAGLVTAAMVWLGLPAWVRVGWGVLVLAMFVATLRTYRRALPAGLRSARALARFVWSLDAAVAAAYLTWVFILLVGTAFTPGAVAASAARQLAWAPVVGLAVVLIMLVVGARRSGRHTRSPRPKSRS